MALTMALNWRNLNVKYATRVTGNIYPLIHSIRNSSKFNKLGFRNIDEVIPKNAMDEFDNNSLETKKGIVYDTVPFKITLKKGVKYAWCTCGQSKSQPLCDGTHKLVELNIAMKPIFFKVDETKDYWICNCKQTEHRPFCDGSHLPHHEEYLKKRREILKKIALSKLSK